MLVHFKIILITIAIFEFIKFTKLIKILNKFKLILPKIFKIINYKLASDHFIQKVILEYSKKIFFLSLKLFLILISIVLLFYLLNKKNSELVQYILSIYGFVELSVILIVYSIFRKKLIG